MLLLSVSLTPSEGKRLIGMSVAQMDAVQHTPSGRVLSLLPRARRRCSTMIFVMQSVSIISK
jgi:hypothetical protein